MEANTSMEDVGTISLDIAYVYTWRKKGNTTREHCTKFTTVQVTIILALGNDKVLYNIL